jgi:hypothetical protein
MFGDAIARKPFEQAEQGQGPSFPLPDTGEASHFDIPVRIPRRRLSGTCQQTHSVKAGSPSRFGILSKPNLQNIHIESASQQGASKSPEAQTGRIHPIGIAERQRPHTTQKRS